MKISLSALLISSSSSSLMKSSVSFIVKSTLSVPFHFFFDHLLKYNSASDYLNNLINTLTY